MRPRATWLALALITLPLAAPAAEYAKANKHGAIDLSIECPSGSTWDPRNGGECRACPEGTKMVLFECRRAIAPVAEKAKYVYRRKIGKKCKKGTFQAGLTRKCYECREGLRHNGALPVEVPGVCFREPRVETSAAKVVAKKSHLDIIDPRNVASVLSDVGCNGYGKDVFFDPIKGGTCWSCPADHPVRTLYPVTSPNACASKACGREGGRPCYVWERLAPSCDKGLIEHPLKNTCVRAADFGCRATIAAARETIDAIRKAREAGNAASEELMKKLPFLKAAIRFAQNQSAHAQARAQGMVDRLGVDEALDGLKKAMPTPEAVERINAINAAMAARRDRLVDALLNADEVCVGDPRMLRGLMREVMAEAGALPPAGFDLGELFGIGRAHAAMTAEGWSVGFLVAPYVIVRINGYPVPLQLLGVQATYRIADRPEDDALSLHLAGGIDVINIGTGRDAVGGVDFFVTQSWATKACDPRGVGAGLLIGNTLGFGFSCAGFSSIAFKLGEIGVSSVKPPRITVTDADGMLRMGMNHARTTTVSKNAIAPGVALTFGPNFAVTFATWGEGATRIHFSF